jgi:hypothetical protein
MMPRVIRRGGQSFATASYANNGNGATTGSGPTGQVAPIGGAASSSMSAGGSYGSRTASQSDNSAGSTGPGADRSQSASSLAAPDSASSLTAIAAAVTPPNTVHAQVENVVGSRPSVDLADAADKLMNQAVQTIHTYQTTAGPAIEARISDPNFGDVRMVVTGRAGEIVQAQLVVHDRVAADAITAAATRMQASGDALAGVNVTVRSDGGGSATGERPGGNAFEAASWTPGNGFGAGGAPGGNGHGQGGGSQSAATAGGDTGRQPGGDVSTGTPRPAPVSHPEAARPNRQMPRTPLRGGSSLDIRA